MVLGGLLFLVDFRWCALTAAVLFGVLAVVQLITLPAQQVVPSRTGLLSDWREVMTDARFLAFAATMAGMSAMENQLFLLMPAAARRAWGWDGASFFPPALGTLATVLCQLHVTRFARGRAGNGRWIAAGLALMGLGFLLPAFLADATPPLASEVALPAVLGITAAVLVLYCGIMLAQPFAMELVPSFGPERLTGTYFGVYYIFSGLAAAGGNALVGWAMDVGGRTGQSWLPWVSCAAFGLVSAAGVGLLHRRDALPVATHGAVPKPRGPDQLQRDHKEAR